jgi:TRAP transporter TAXI family solute receptor
MLNPFNRNRPHFQRSFAGLIAGLAAVTAAFAANAQNLPVIEKSPQERAAIRDNLVGIVSGSPAGVYARMGNDIRRLFDDREKHSLRLAVLIGSGSVNNLDDLRNLPGVALAIVQGDVLEEYAADKTQFAALKQNIRAISRLHTEILHVVTRKDVIARKGTDTICALAGSRINVGTLGSGTAITVRKVFNDILRLNVTLDPASQDEAFDQLASGKVDAVIFVVGRKAPFFANPDLSSRFAKDGFDWLAAPPSLFEKGCGNPLRIGRDAYVYEDATLTSADYPQLIAKNKSLSSIGVPAILAAYKFDDLNSPRSRATGRFIEEFLARAGAADGFGKAGGGYDANWCGVDLGLPPKSWRQHETAVNWLASPPGRAARTKIECASTFCTSDAAKLAEFDRRRVLDKKPTEPTPDYMREFARFEKSECR